MRYQPTTSCGPGASWLRALSLIAWALPLIVIVPLGCGRDTRWKFLGQAVDENGSPVPGAQVNLSARPDLHGLKAQLGGATGVAEQLTTDDKGMFTVDYKCRTLSFEVHKSGYISKKFIFDPAVVNPEALPRTAKIRLVRQQPLPEPDELDMRGDQELLLRFPRPQDAVAVSLLDGTIVLPSDPNAAVSFQLRPHALRVEGLHGAELSSIEWDTGLTVESWKQNHQTMPNKTFDKSLTIKCPFHPGSVEAAGAFFVRDTDSHKLPYYARIVIFTVTPDEFHLSFDLSSDEFFVHQR